MPTTGQPRPRLRFPAAVALLVLASIAAAPPAVGGPAPERDHPSFQPIGDLPGGRFQSEALVVSDDGRLVVGESASARSGDGAEAFLWSPQAGLEPLGGAFPPPIRSQPRACTPGCRAIVGQSISPGGQPIATIWNGREAPRALGDLPGGGEASGALAVSTDGRLVAGWAWSASGFEAAAWRLETEGGTPLGDLPGGPTQAAIAGITRNGKVMVGTGNSPLGSEFAIWTDEGVRGLGDLAGGAYASEPFAITSRGDVIVGRGASTGCTQAVRWTEADGFEPLGDLVGGACESAALAVSDDGASIIGYATTAAGSEAFYWTRATGLVSLRAWLAGAGVAGLEGWKLTVANAISADGRVIVGGGVNPSGQPEGWIVRLEQQP